MSRFLAILWSSPYAVWLYQKSCYATNPKPNPTIFPHFERKPPNPPPMIHMRDGLGNREEPLMVVELAAEQGGDEFCGGFRAICDCAVEIVHAIFVMRLQRFHARFDATERQAV